MGGTRGQEQEQTNKCYMFSFICGSLKCDFIKLENRIVVKVRKRGREDRGKLGNVYQNIVI